MARQRKSRAQPRKALRKNRQKAKAKKPRIPRFWERVTRFWHGPDKVADQAYAKDEAKARAPTVKEVEAAKAAGAKEVERRATVVETAFDPEAEQQKVPFFAGNLGGFITEKGREAFERHAFSLPNETRMISRLQDYMRPDQVADLRRAYVADRFALQGLYDEREVELTSADEAGRTNVRKFANYIAGGYMESCIEPKLTELIRDHRVTGAKKQFPAWLDKQLRFFDRAIFVRGPADWVQDELERRLDLGPARPSTVTVHALGPNSQRAARIGTAAFCNKHSLAKPEEAQSVYMKGEGIAITVRL